MSGMKDTVRYDGGRNAVVILDQTKLPNEETEAVLATVDDVWEAVRSLMVRGAPAIGITAGYGMALGARRAFEADPGMEPQVLLGILAEIREYLDSARPTAVNLPWATERMQRAAEKAAEEGLSSEMICARLVLEAGNIQTEDEEMCRRIGENGLTLLHPGDGILTHCNAGRLAASRYGTATAPLYLGMEKGYDLRVYADETRPLLQGARLTAYELAGAGIDVTLLCDDMTAAAMRAGKIDAVLVGCDRMAANGDFANKIGTLQTAVCARHFGIPFYVCLPTSSIDFRISDGEMIVIEERAPEEVTDMWFERRMAPESIRVYNPAFDVTDHSLITAIVTEKGVLYPPFSPALERIRD